MNPQRKLEKGYYITAHRLGASDLYQVEFLPRGLQQWRGAGNAPRQVPPGYKATVSVADGAASFNGWDTEPRDAEIPNELFERQAEATASREDLIERGKRLYDENLRDELAPLHAGRFLAVEPGSRKYFIGDTDVEALAAARDAMPGRRFYLVRIGYEAAHSIGGHALSHR